MDKITGKTLIDWGYKPGEWFGEAIKYAESCRLAGLSEDEIHSVIRMYAPPPPIPLQSLAKVGYINHLPQAETEDEFVNMMAVGNHMDQLMQTPTLRMGAVMPDACPAGNAPGTIPVGGVVAAENAIHPGFHSSDICCSLALSVFSDDADPSTLLDAGMQLSHFGGGGRAPTNQILPPDYLLKEFMENPFLSDMDGEPISHFATQGDGNHFYSVGRMSTTGKLALVTHHGSRKPGAILYKRGMTLAQKMTAKISPDTLKHNAWIPADTKEGHDYWDALQTIRKWTKANHFAIHDLVARWLNLQLDFRMWNEHNFVFQKSDGLFYHAKGATPVYGSSSDDDCGLYLIPMNMAEPILLVRGGLSVVGGLGFAPHGAGRNVSRTRYKKLNDHTTEEELVREQTKGLDVRFYSGYADVTELPGAYKNSGRIMQTMQSRGLAEIVGMINPYGCIMAGDWTRKFKEKR